MNSELALTILLQNIKNIKELNNEENKWILHSIYVGIASRRIAQELKLDEDYALTIGYMHDIGRIINHQNHPIEGFLYLNNLGYPDIARYSLTHSFIDNVITNTAGGGPKDIKSFNFINNYLHSIKLNIYDNIIQLCDLFCLESGFTTIEKRMLDITKRKGVYDNSYEHYLKVIELKESMELKMGINLYALFPEIKEEDINNIQNDYNELLELIQKNKKK